MSVHAEHHLKLSFAGQDRAVTDKSAQPSFLDVARDRFAVCYDPRSGLRTLVSVTIGRGRARRRVIRVIVVGFRFRSGTSSHSDHMTMNSFAFLIVEKASLYR